MSDVQVRRATPNDLARMRAMWQEAAEQLDRLDPRFRLAPDGGSDWEAAARGWLANPDMAVFVAVADEKTLGFVVGLIAPNRPGWLPTRIGAVTEMAVDFHAKRGGLGTALLKALSAWFQAHGVDLIEARIPVSHPVAQAFWRSIGAAKSGDQMWLGLALRQPSAEPAKS